MPLAEFVDPFIKDTINGLSFTVNVNIRNYTGAPVNTPELYIETILGGSCSIHNYDTITMEQTGDIWAADVPRQYYNSKVIYTLHVSDALGNAIVIMDSVYIRFNSDEGGELYDDNHLAIFDLLSPPANSQNSLCLPDYLPAQIQLSNIGNNDYDFTQDNIAIGYEIINSWGPAFRGEAR